MRTSVIPNLPDYEKTYASFSWEHVQQALDGLPGNHGLNIAHEAVDRHAHTQRTAFRWLGKAGEIKDFTYQALSEETNRFANVLQGLGIGKGNRVFLLTGRIPELYIAALGTWKNTSVFFPLFSAFSPDPIAQRLHRGDARILVTTTRLYRKKVEGLLTQLPDLKYVLLVDAAQDITPRYCLSPNE